MNWAMIIVIITVKGISALQKVRRRKGFNSNMDWAVKEAIACCCKNSQWWSAFNDLHCSVWFYLFSWDAIDKFNSFSKDLSCFFYWSDSPNNEKNLIYNRSLTVKPKFVLLFKDDAVKKSVYDANIYAIVLGDRLPIPQSEKASFDFLESMRSLTVFLQQQTSVAFCAQSTLVLDNFS